MRGRVPGIHLEGRGREVPDDEVGYALARMRERRSIAAVAGLLVALAMAACGSTGSHGSSNGVASKTANQIVARATQAIDRVSSVRVRGTVADSSAHVMLDLNLVNGKGAPGSMSENGLSFSLITVGGRAYIHGSSSFWKQFGGAAAVRQLQGKWLRASSDSGDFASFSSLTNLRKLLSGLLAGHGALTKGAQSTIDGRRAIALHDTSKHGTLYVATTGTPYPLRIVNGGPDGGELDFSDFDAAVSLKPPASSIDISELRK